MSTEPLVLPIVECEKDLLRNLMQAYRHDMSEFDNADPDERGAFGLGQYFELYWTEPTRHAFKFLVCDALAGFALVRELGPQTCSMAEFFVLRRHRNSGVGRKAACILFEKFPGTWHIAQDEYNAPSQLFWRRVIGEYTGGSYEETWSELQPRGPKQVFSSGAQPRAASDAAKRRR